MKKLRAARSLASFIGVLGVIFAPQRGIWRYIDIKSAMVLVCVCHEARRTLRKWLDEVAFDISQGRESLPVPVQLPTTNFHANLHAVLQLMTFTYTTSVQLPSRHNLPPDLLTKQQSDERCQRVLRGRHVDVVVAQCKGKGWGVLAAQDMEQRTFVGEYTGELVGTREMQRRYRERYDPQSLNYVLSLREHVTRQGVDSLDCDVVRTNIDATNMGNLTRFVNHSCSPTLEVVAVRVDSFVPRLVFFTRRQIEAGEELTFDYGAAHVIEGGRPCRCGALNCRGYLPSDVSE